MQAQRFCCPCSVPQFSLQLRNPHRDLHAAPVDLPRLLLHLAKVHGSADGTLSLHLGDRVECPVQPPPLPFDLALKCTHWRVMFARTTDLVQRLQVARRELALESAIAKLDRYDLLILDDIAYVTKDHAETSVLFELIAARYERRSMLITANQPFGEWGKISPIKP